MISIKVETVGVEKAIGLLREFPKTLQQATGKSIAFSGRTAREIVRQSLASGGGGKWPKPHPLSLLFTRKWGRQKHFGNLPGLAQFSRYSMTDKGFITGFGTFPEHASYKAKFKPIFMFFSRTMQGKTIHVTDKMRRKMGATRREKNAIPGIDFFPLKANTKTLHVPKRLIEFQTQEITGKFVETLKQSFQ